MSRKLNALEQRLHQAVLAADDKVRIHVDKSHLIPVVFPVWRLWSRCGNTLGFLYPSCTRSAADARCKCLPFKRPASRVGFCPTCWPNERGPCSFLRERRFCYTFSCSCRPISSIWLMKMHYSLLKWLLTRMRCIDSNPERPG